MNSPKFARRRWAFTMIEVLVVIAVITLLVAILLPTLSAMRDSARRLECTNRLKQVGVAQHGYQVMSGSFIPPMPLRITKAPNMETAANFLSGIYELLPFLEQAALANSFNISDGSTYHYSLPLDSNLTAANTRLQTLICPADSSATSAPGGPTSYRFGVYNVQPTGYRSLGDTPAPASPIAPNLVGAYIPDLPSRAEQFTDGLSQTISISERVLGGAKDPGYDPRRDIWGGGLAESFVAPTLDAVATFCMIDNPDPLDHESDLGRHWSQGGNQNLWFNHVLTPNSRINDCLVSVASSSSLSYGDRCAITARSQHAGGVNCLLMDGSVRFVRESISLSAWRALGTRAGADLEL